MSTLTYSAVTFGPEAYPNLSERYYPLPSGQVAVVTQLAMPAGDISHPVVLHSERPCSGDWWDTAISEVAYCHSFAEAEAAIAALSAA